jgi:hypothetical protein
MGTENVGSSSQNSAKNFNIDVILIPKKSADTESMETSST